MLQTNKSSYKNVYNVIHCRYILSFLVMSVIPDSYFTIINENCAWFYELFSFESNKLLSESCICTVGK